MPKGRPKISGQDLKNAIVAVRSIINNVDNKILLVKRSKTRTMYPNKWELPGGQFAKYENLKEAVEGIVYEKFGLAINSISENYYCHNRFVTESEKYRGNNYIEITSVSTLIAGNIKLDREDYSDFIWINVDDVFLYELTIESQKALMSYVSEINDLKRLDEPTLRPMVLVGRALIKNNKNEYLMIKRNSTNTYPDTWELPGGKLNMLETIDAAIVREIFEETGLVIQIKKLAVYINSIIQNSGRYKGYTYVNLVSDAFVTSGELRLTEKHSKYKWVSKNEISELKLAPYMEMQIAEIFLTSN